MKKVVGKGRSWRILARVSSRKIPVKVKAVKELVNAVLSHEPFNSLPEKLSEVSVVITNDSAIHRLNKEYRGKDKPTDVLSFPQAEALELGVLSPTLGDLVISYDTLKRQAREYNVTPRQELLRLVIHGLLHLIGYDHEGVAKSEAAKMRRIERRLYGILCKPSSK